jgi:Fe2+ transport protein
MKFAIVTVAALLALPTLAVAQQPAAAKVKVLAAPEDPRQKTILVGRSETAGMIVQFELEPAKSMWMRLGPPPRLDEHRAQATERYHVEIKPIDPISKTRISFTRVSFSAVNRTTGKEVSFFLHPMWGSSGLHYASNSALLGDGIYVATVTVELPAFARDEKTKDMWLQPIVTVFHFKLKEGALVEVSEAIPPPT